MNRARAATLSLAAGLLAAVVTLAAFVARQRHDSQHAASRRPAASLSTPVSGCPYREWLLQ
jgi:hypothetical protein